MMEITPEVEEMVQGLLNTGRYKNESEIDRGAVTLPHRRDRLLVEIETGMAESDVGKLVYGEGVFR